MRVFSMRSDATSFIGSQQTRFCARSWILQSESNSGNLKPDAAVCAIRHERAQSEFSLGDAGSASPDNCPKTDRRTVGGDVGGAQREAGGGSGRGAQQEVLAVLFDLVSVRESRSARMSGQETRGGAPFAPVSARAAMRSSSSFFRTSARKLRET